MQKNMLPLLWAVALIATPAALRAQLDFKAGSVPVQIHSFGSQGFAYSNQNNYLTMKTSEGSFAMTDGGANVSARISDKFRVGAQVYISNVGELNKWRPQLDWAFADYKAKDWLGIRAGKVKTALGLFNDTQDLETLHNWALLPQGLYPIDLRDNTIAHTGVDLYGEIGLRSAGSMSYTAYAGKGGNNKHGGYYFSTEDNGAPITKFDTKVAGGDVRWNTKISGLVSGFSYMKKDSTLEGKLNAAGGLPYVIESSPQYLMSWYGDLTRGKVHLSAEYRRDHEILDILTFGTHNLSDFSSHGWFAAGSYKINKKLEVGSYYSAFYVNHPQAPGNAANHLFDKTVSARYDVTRYFHVKVEGHFIDGYGDLYSAHGFYLRSNPTGTKPTTNLFIVRTGFSF